MSTPVPERKVQPLQIEKPTRREPCKDLAATKSLPVAASGRILFLAIMVLLVVSVSLFYWFLHLLKS